MERKEFFKKALQFGLASGSVCLSRSNNIFPQSGNEQSKQKSKDHKQIFKEKWITSLIENIDKQLDEKTKKELMLSCGRECARRGAIHIAESCNGDVDVLVEKLERIVGKENCVRKDDKVHLKYPKCFCELVADGPKRLSDTYCICSMGWIHEMFETVVQRPVKVEALQTIKRGASSCKFNICI